VDDPRSSLHRQVAAAACAKSYLAESERAGNSGGAEGFSQVPDVSERFISFDRFLQEYEIVAASITRTSYASTI